MDRTPALVCLSMYTTASLPKYIKWEGISPCGECIGVAYANGGKELAKWLPKIRVLTDRRRDWVIYTDTDEDGQNDVQDWCERRYRSTHRKPIVYLRLELGEEGDEYGGYRGAWYKAEWSPSNPKPDLVRFSTYVASAYGGVHDGGFPM